MPRAPKALRDAVKDLGVMKVAYECGVSPQAVHGWLNGAEPKAKPLLRLAQLAGLPVDPRLKRLAGLEED